MYHIWYTLQVFDAPMKARYLITIDFVTPMGGGGDLDVPMVLQAPKPVWHMHYHKYHERLDTHGMVLDHHAKIEHSNTMIYTI
jgi:hypothetical protein